MSSFGGFNIIQNPGLVKKVQARKHKKKRINKKWLRRYGTKYIPDKTVIIIDYCIIVHPVMYEKIKKMMIRREG